MSRFISNRGSNSVTTIHTATDLDDTTYAHTTYYDDESLKQNARIRSSGMLENSKLGLHDNEDIRGVLSIPSIEQYNLFKVQNPNTYQLLTSKLEHERVQGLKEVSLLEPEWVLTLRL